MDRRWELLEKYFDEELTDDEEKQFNEILRADEDFYNEFIQYRRMIDDIGSMSIPDIKSRQTKIMEIIHYINPGKKNRFTFALPVFFSYSLITTIFLAVRFKEIIFTNTWNYTKTVVFGLFDIIAKAMVIFPELDSNAMLILCCIPIVSFLIAVPSGVIIRKEIKKGGHK